MAPEPACPYRIGPRVSPSGCSSGGARDGSFDDNEPPVVQARVLEPDLCHAIRVNVVYAYGRNFPEFPDHDSHRVDEQAAAGARDGRRP